MAGSVESKHLACGRAQPWLIRRAHSTGGMQESASFLKITWLKTVPVLKKVVEQSYDTETHFILF